MKKDKVYILGFIGILLFTAAKVGYKYYAKLWSEDPPQENAEQLTEEALRLIYQTQFNSDSIALGIEKFDQAIALSSILWPPHRYLYSQKAIAQSLLGKYEVALTTLDNAEKEHGGFWMDQYNHALISDKVGDTISAKLNYERVIEYCQYKLNQMDSITDEYNAIYNYVFYAKLLRYGNDSIREDMDRLKASEDYRKGTEVHAFVEEIEQFNKEKYLKNVFKQPLIPFGSDK